MFNPFYEEVERQLLASETSFARLSGFLQEGLSAYRERRVGLMPDEVYGSEAYYEALVGLRRANPQGFARSFSAVTSASLDRFLNSREVSALRAA